jgi:sugar lactone lactonase YvrE
MLVSASSIADDIPAFTISTIAGTGDFGTSGEGGLATEAQMNRPTAVAVDTQGNVYIADSLNRRVLKIDSKGIIAKVMGTGKGSLQREDLPAIETNLSQPYGIAVDAQDNLYVLNRGHSKIHKVTPDGMAHTIAGTGRRGFNGDEIPATQAQIAGSNHLAVDAAGNVLIADTGNQRIRKITTDGIIHTIAGTGEQGFNGDGGAAAQAQLANPSAIAVDGAGNIYIADFSNHRIRKIDTEGIITTVAGTGTPEYNGDGIPATTANIGEPTGVAVDAGGLVYISDQVNDRVRVVLRDGIIMTVAGTGERGYTGDGGPSTEALINIPDIICLDRAGNLYMPDHQNFVVRKLTRIAK